MDKIIFTYALIKSLYDLEEDYIDCFLPFIIKSFNVEEELNMNIIQKKVKENSNLDIPIHSLNTILYHAERRGFVEKNGKKYTITKEGLEYLVKSETEQEVNRRIRALIDDMKKFFNNNGHDLENKELQDLICSFINKNFKILVDFLNPSNNAEIRNKKLDINENILFEYIIDAEKKKPEHYKTLRDMILGSLISATIYSKKTSQLNKIKDNWFECQIYFDTNFIFSILGLHTSNFNDPAQELFKLLKRNEFELKVFDFTLDEITNVINSYPVDQNRYPKSVNVNTLYSNLKAKNWTKTDVIRFITDLETTLAEKGIVIETTDVDMTTYKPKDENFISKLHKYKDGQRPRAQLHDLAAIDTIKKLRKKSIRKFEDSNALFLTSDIQLSKFNLIEMHHKDQGTISEVILDKFLTNILWLKDPNADISLKAIIESYSQDLFDNRRVWDKFYNVLQGLRVEGKINDENVSMLFYHGELESLLNGFGNKDIDNITPDFILKEFDRAEQLKEEDLKEIEEKEKEFLKELENEKQYHANQIREVKENLKIAAKKESKLYASIIAITSMFLIFLVGLYVIILIYNILKSSSDSILLMGIITFIALFIAFVGIPNLGIYSKFHLRLENMLFRKLYEKKLKEAKLEE